MDSHKRSPPKNTGLKPRWWVLVGSLVLLLGLSTAAFLPGNNRVTAHPADSDKGSTPLKDDATNLSQLNRSLHEANGHRSTSVSRQLSNNYEGPSELRQQLLQNQARPLSLAAADFDEDGVPDLVSGYSSLDHGIVALRRGNVDTIYPNTPEAKARESLGTSAAAAFLSPARILPVPQAPDFLGTGDFDADGHWDLVMVARGGTSLTFLSGDGLGNFTEIHELQLPGAATAMVTGEINRADGLTDVVVGISNEAGAEALVYEAPGGARKAQPESFPLPAAATSLALGRLRASYTIDLAIAAGTDLLIVSGRDRRLSLAPKEQAAVPGALVSRRSFAQVLKSIAIGQFNGIGQAELALLFDGGAVQVLTPGPANRSKGVAQRSLARWSTSEFQFAGAGGESLVSAHFSTFAGDDLLLLDRGSRQLRTLQNSQTGGVNAGLSGVTDAQRQLLEQIAADAAPVAVLPMRLDVDALSDLVVLRENMAEPALILTTLKPNQESQSTTPALNSPSFGTKGGPGTAGTLGQASPVRIAVKSTAPQENEKVKAGRKEWQRPESLAACPTVPISVGQTINGTLATTDCFLQDGAFVDFYTFTGTTGQLVSVALNSSAFDAYLYLVSPDGSLLSNDDDGGPGTNAQIPTAGGFISLPANGTYTIYATSFGSGIGAYSVTLTEASGGTCPTTPITSGVNINASLSATDCVFTSGPRTGSFVDLYTFGGVTGQQVIVAMASTNFDTYLYLVAPNGSVIAENDDILPGIDKNSRIPLLGSLTLPATGVYTVQATSFSPGVIGSYAIGISVSGASTVVTNTLDNGPGSLRQAILNANANQGVDIISFQVPPPRTIFPLTALPEITDPVVIDGTTQPGFAGTPLIELSGLFTPAGTTGLKVSAGSSRIRGLAINRFGAVDCLAPLNAGVAAGTAIQLVSVGNNIVDGNFIGTDLSGTAVACNSGNGVYLFNSSSNTIGGTTAAARNVISGNRFPGIAIGGEFSTLNLVAGNYVGTDVTGTVDLGNQSNGIFVVNGFNHLIGGTVPGSRNVVSGNNSPGIGIGFSDPIGILVQGNYIGTNAAGNAAIPNLGGGLIIGGFFQLNGNPITATDNTIGGTSPAARNVISGNLRTPGDTNPDAGNGIEIINEGSQRNKVQGNFIGLNANGNGVLPNAGSGVFITRAPNNFVGADDRTDLQGTTNYIAGNGRYGIGVGIRRLNDTNPGQFITGGDSVDIVFNVIGTDPTQTMHLGNALDGVFVDADSVNIYVNSNIIAFNGRYGVRIPDANGIADDNDNSGRLVNVDLNYIFGNGSRAIDLGLEGITPNDVSDVDGGANLQQNFPQLTSASIAAPEGTVGGKGPGPASVASINVNGTLSSAPNTTYTVHWYFSPDTQCVSNAQSSRPLAFGRIAGISTNGSGSAPFSFSFDFPPGVTIGVINTTATDAAGNTSEYSECLAINPTLATVKFSSSSYSVGEGGVSATITVVRTGSTTGASTVDFASSDGTALQSQDYVVNSGTISFAAGETSKTFSLLIVDDAFVESSESINLTLSNPTGATLAAPSTATLSITDNDTAGSTSPAATRFAALLDAAQQIPTNSSQAKGTGYVLLNQSETSASVSLRFQGLGSAETGAHIHGPAAAGASAPALFTLPNTNPVTNFQISPTAGQVANLKAGLHYLDAHSTNFSNGEIRGQLRWSPTLEENFFVRQQYLDFLSRDGDPGGFGFWVNQVGSCGADAQCLHDRTISTSNAFFFEPEFQQTAGYVFRAYRAAFGNNQPFPNPDGSNATEANKLIDYAAFVADRARVVGGANLAQTQQDFANQFVLRSAFTTKYAGTTTAGQFVDAILATIQTADAVNLSSQRQTLIDQYNNAGGGNTGRAMVLYRLSDDNAQSPMNNQAFITAEYNRQFALTLYFGYLRRNPDIGGFLFWQSQINLAPLRDVPKQNALVCSFLTAAEYQLRFGPNAPRSNAECPQ